MRWQDWLVGALGDKSLSFIDADELAVRNALREFFACQTPIIEHAEATLELAKRIKHLEQFHCEHEFSDKRKGCLESLFCSKCGALHPEWEQTFPHRFGFGPGEKPVGYLIVDGKHYRTKASKPKGEG